jgi:hypothetical protein
MHLISFETSATRYSVAAARIVGKPDLMLYAFGLCGAALAGNIAAVDREPSNFEVYCEMWGHHTLVVEAFTPYGQQRAISMIAVVLTVRDCSGVSVASQGTRAARSLMNAGRPSMARIRTVWCHRIRDRSVGILPGVASSGARLSSTLPRSWSWAMARALSSAKGSNSGGRCGASEMSALARALSSMMARALSSAKA